MICSDTGVSRNSFALKMKLRLKHAFCCFLSLQLSLIYFMSFDGYEYPEKVFVVGFPKSGTTSIARFFDCANVKTSHWKCGEQMCGRCIQKNVQNRQDPLRGCGDFSVWAQLDVEVIFLLVSRVSPATLCKSQTFNYSF